MNGPNDWAGLRPAALALGTAAVVTVVAGGAYALSLKLHFDTTQEALYGARVGSHLLILIALAAGILILGVVVGRPALLRPNAHVLAAGAAILSLVLSLASGAHAYRQLHPSFATERAALVSFSAPAGVIAQSTTTQVTAARNISRYWAIVGQPITVCTNAKASFRAWADPGSVQPTAAPTPGCSFLGRKGPDNATLYAVFVPNDNHISLSLTLTHVNQGA